MSYACKNFSLAAMEAGAECRTSSAPLWLWGQLASRHTDHTADHHCRSVLQWQVSGVQTPPSEAFEGRKKAVTEVIGDEGCHRWFRVRVRV